MPLPYHSLTPYHLGRWVMYDPGYGDPEYGRIKSFNSSFVFVVYKCSGDWDHYQDYTAQGTHPDRLTLCEAPDPLPDANLV